ncbi:MAG: hypothetical protein HY707_14195 [Ignavibacteriae bacterium]|nr:hypothetical protein [Ignavibacteriota bacterium]
MLEPEHRRIFPFGQPLHEVKQTDRTQKDVFVLGVYASAVHARWIPPKGIKGIAALAVASEPYIFWKGDKAEEIISQIEIPNALGKLKPAGEKFNGPSGLALDKFYLEPLGLTREQCWLSDLVPYSCLNDKQEKAIEERYNPHIDKYSLPHVTIPGRPKTKIEFTEKKNEIIDEIKQAKPKLVISLGDEPIKWFFSRWLNGASSIKDLILTLDAYGKFFSLTVDGMKFNLLPLTHPRQAGKLGQHSKEWNALHGQWMRKVRHEDKTKYFEA